MKKIKRERNYIMFLEDIFDSAEKIEKYTHNFDIRKLMQDERAQDAVIRRFEIIGEAVKKLPAGFKKEHKDIPWKEIAGMRDVLIHEYFGVNTKRIWKSIEEDIPDLKGKIHKILKSLKQQKLLS